MPPPYAGAQRAALLALGITFVLTIAKVVTWLTTSSLAVLSQAIDSALDVVAMSLLAVGLRVAAKPADASHHYGHAKAENLVAFAQTLILAGIVCAIAIEAVSRLADSSAPATAPGYAFAVLLVSAAIDVFRVRLLARASTREESQALAAGALNVAADLGTALVAVVSLALVRAGWDQADSIGGLVVAAGVAIAAWQVGRRSVDVLMDRAPADPEAAIQRAAASVPGVAETRRVRVRSSGNQLFADVTVTAGRTASLERAHDISDAVERRIKEAVPATDVVVHVEPATETSGLVERVQAAASRTEGVHEVHNVNVRALDNSKTPRLQVSLHAKVPEAMTLERAHELSERIEKNVAAELGEDVRVDAHMEPLETTSLARDVTSERRDIAEVVRAAAVQEPDVLDCHEVLVTQVGDSLSVTAHVRGRSDLSLERIHAATERIEKTVQLERPEVDSVLIHFEPA